MKVKKWKYKECEPDEGAVCSCSAWVCLKLPLSPLSTQVDMSCSDSHPHSCHSFFFLPPPIFYPCSSALNQQNQSIIFLFPHSWPDCSKPETHTRCLIGITEIRLEAKVHQYLYIFVKFIYGHTFWGIVCLHKIPEGRIQILLRDFCSQLSPVTSRRSSLVKASCP